MYFKRIEMHGFKSFAEPVTIEFHRGITCVVGPNGSGKSNISDAIRWVLGEQSPKMLRGGKMEEVIFSGTANRKSRGMAEVTLVIDNEEGILPIDYNEVAITRRMFRSGESEYSINNNQCRLRDIRELIMDTGIGVDGYSLIGQGKISDIVSNKTESRREIFEEAAGIVMYRTKKAESERKLSSTSANLERVNDIIGEIEGRIDRLREDSIKAKEFIGLRDQNKELEINITLKNIESLELKNEYIKDDISELKNKLDEIRDSRQAMDRQLTESRQKSEQLEQLITEGREKLVQSIEEINGLVSQGQLAGERLSTIETNTARLNDEIRILEDKLKKETANARELYQTKEQADREMEQVNRALQEKIRLHGALSDELSQAAAQADEYKDEIFRTHSAVSSQRAEISSLENLRETLERRKTQIQAEKSSGEDSNRDTLDALNKLRADKSQLEEELGQLENELSQNRAQYDSSVSKERKLAGQLEDLRISIGQLSSRKKTIEEMESNYEGYNYAVKYIMRSGLPGIHGTVAELISVPQGLEVAIETALGAAMQNIVCEDDRSAQGAIARLKESRAGRLTFLPISSIRGGRGHYETRLEQETGFQGFGTDCIRFEDQYRPVMEYLLGRVVIVDTMEHAVKLSKKAAGLRFVTLEGEIINAGGAITGGRYKNKTANLLERKAEVTRLAEQLKAAREEKSQGTEQLADLRQEIERLRGQIAGKEQTARKLEMDIFSRENELTVTESALNDFKTNSGKWEKELENIRDEQESSQRMIRQLEDKIRQEEKTISEKETQAGELLDLCDGKKARLESVSEEITAARIEAGACESRKNGADEMAERVKASIEELEQEKRHKQQQIADLAAEKDSLRCGHIDIESVVKEKEEAKENLEQYLADLSSERTSASSEADRLTREKEEADRQVNALQDQKYELEIKEAKNETQLDSYKEKLWEDFEVSYIQAMEFKKQDFVMSSAVKENRRIKNRMKELGEVNIGAIEEYETVSERYEFLTAQRSDILEAMDSLNAIISDMDRTIKARFKESFDQVVVNFEQVFSDLFGGGHAELRLDDENNPLESGIDIIAQPPGKKLQNINLLSGGEKTMTAIALMFAVLKTKPTPFCILDEVEAALDDANIERFAKYLKTFEDIQFTLVTHQKATMEHADVLYGVTMPEQGISKVLSLNMGDDFQL
ncbi:chromosome segregation protein SMC [Anaerovorax odorimutans]|uniref:Chromosome partition protein Smc n=1 Tax=Anaerovorax odorimutans TaxID=109327 RepID=A0ABT1RK19_9FIRM|nr:chromosome segregation protein SMC [Anaerovorax odorimutans]MCQ4635541.1 chromosome segregation protein SMC [Anaerovorax odorimutans]